MPKKKSTPEKKKTKKKLIDLLPDKEKSIVLEYVSNGFNQTQAYKKYSPKTDIVTCRTLAARVFTKVGVKEALNEYFKDLWERKEEEIGKTFLKLLSFVHADISDVADFKDGELIIKDFDKAKTGIIRELSQAKTLGKYGESVKNSIKIVDQTKSMSDLIRVLNMINEKMTVSIKYDKEAAKEIQDTFNEEIEDE